MKQKIEFKLVLIFVFFFASTVLGGTINVPGDHPTIQAGIDAALEGDTVVVAAGKYTGIGNYDLDYKGKSITVVSERGAGSCIIDCETNGRGIAFQSSEDKNAILDGFTIMNGYTVPGYPVRSGGGILIQNSSPSILNCNLMDNEAFEQGGALYCNNGSPELTGCFFSDNRIPEYDSKGGGIYCNQSTMILTDCSIDGNSAWMCGRGGGVYGKESFLTFMSCIIDDNWAEGCGGGGLFIDNSSLYLEDCLVSSNDTSIWGGEGGGLLGTNGSSLTIVKSTFKRNHSEWDGGGIYINDRTSALIMDSLFEKNSSSNFDYGGNAGGGILIKTDAPCVIINCIIRNNQVWGHYAHGAPYGGGIACRLGSPVIVNCLIINNTANYFGSGGGIASMNSTAQPVFQNCTISGNIADSEGGGLYCRNSSPLIKDSIFWGDSPNEVFSTGGTPRITFSDIEGGYPGAGNIDSDPLFCTGPNGDYYLAQTKAGQLVNSPCLNTGSDLSRKICYTTSEGTICMNNLTTRTDQVVDSGQVDMGFHYKPIYPVRPTPTPSTTPTLTPTIPAGYYLDLCTGLNLISNPYYNALASKSSTLLADICPGSADAIWEYNCVSKKFRTFTVLDPGDGWDVWCGMPFWVNIINPSGCRWVPDGILETDIHFELCRGLNIVAIPLYSASLAKASELLAVIPGCDGVWRLKREVNCLNPLGFDAYLILSEPWEDYTVAAGRSYWINVLFAIDWFPPNP